jgi:hypothetical protein
MNLVDGRVDWWLRVLMLDERKEAGCGGVGDVLMRIASSNVDVQRKVRKSR